MAMIGAGTHMVRVKDVAMGASPNGTEQASVTFVDEHDDTITWFTTLGFKRDGSFSKKAFDYAVKAFKAIGFDAEAHGFDFECLNGDVGADLRGSECEIVVEDEEYEGKTYTRVKWVNDLSGGGFQLDQASAGNFQKRLRAALAREGVAVKAAPSRAAPARQSDPVPPAGGFDDIPF